MHFQPGDEIQGKYRVQRLLGKGGQAEVYLVTHLSLGVDRAIKVISREMVGVGSQVFADFRRRFAQEAKLGAGLKDARLVHVYDLLESPELAILEMEYVPGGSLAELIAAAKQQGRALPLERCLAIGADMAAALASLHVMDIVHRDLKPANVLVDSQGRANVGDLGLAQSPWGDSRRSLLGEDAPRHPGTPAYMSPEQDSDRGHLLPSSDCYTWAAVLFEVLSLRLWRNVPPDTRASKLRDDVPQWLDDLLASCLADNPRERPWDGTALQQALEDGPQEEENRRRQAAEAEAQARLKAEAEAAAAAEQRAEEARKQEAKAAEERRQAEARRKAEEEAAEAKRRAVAASEQAERAEAARREEAELRASADRAHRAAEERLKREEEEQQRKEIMRAERLKAGLLVLAVLGALVLWRLGLPGTPPRQVSDPVPENRVGTGLPADDLPDIVWVEVPAGNFMIGSDSDYDDEKPRRTVTLDAFRISKYETTNAQYQAFVQAPDGFDNSEWWQGLAGGGGEPGAPNWSGADLPAENVSWYDAVAFTRWMTARLRLSGDLEAGMEIRLPTEEEWEKAARGTDGRVYPWGNTYEARKANINESFTGAGPSDLRRTTAVGSYPEGASPFGALDMAGNVWEWTLTEYESKQSKDLTNARPRVARGGSWVSYPESVRASYRSSFGPANRLDFIGFRMVLGAPVQ